MATLLAGLFTFVACNSSGETDDSAAPDLYAISASWSPDPPTAGTENTLTLVMTADGTAIDGASLEIVPWMPDHGHGISEEVLVEDLGEGSYEAVFIYSMSGYWELEIHIDADLGSEDHIVPVDVE